MYNNHDESNNPTFMTHIRRIPDANQAEQLDKNERQTVEMDDAEELPSHITIVPFIKTQTGSFQ